MTKMLVMLAAACTASACAASASTGAAHPAPSVQCAIEQAPTRHGMRFEALAHADAPAFGAYRFVLTKIDAGGSSDIVQEGEFDLRAGEEMSLGGAELSLERRARYLARLELRDGDEIVCDDEVGS